jgi:hypothetical protein
MKHGHNNEEPCDDCFAAEHIETCRYCEEYEELHQEAHLTTCKSCELHPEWHPMKPWQQWELDGYDQAVDFARKHKRLRLYQALTGDVDEGYHHSAAKER